MTDDNHFHVKVRNGILMTLLPRQIRQYSRDQAAFVSAAIVRVSSHSKFSVPVLTKHIPL